MNTLYIYFLEIGLAIVINGLIFVLFVSNRALRKTVSNIFLINLMVSDILTGVAAAVSLTVHLSKSNRDDKKAEALFMYIFTAMMFSCLLSVLLVTADRFIAIVMPYRYQTLLRKRNVRILLVVTWLFIIAFIISGVALATSDHPQTLKIAMDGLNYVIVVIATVGIVFLILTNSFIFREVRRQVKIISSVSVYDSDTAASKKHENKLRKKELRAAYLCFAIVGLFIITWGPFVISLATKMKKSDDSAVAIFFTVCQFLVFAGLIINPCLYVPFKTELRDKLRMPFRKFRNKMRKDEDVKEPTIKNASSTTKEIATMEQSL